MANLTGLADLNRRMQALSRDMATKVGQSANRAGAAVIAREAKKNVPVSSVAEGATQNRKRKSGQVVQDKHRKIVNNIKVRKTKPDSSTKVQNTVTVGNAYHAIFVEFGSIHNAPNPFMRTAYEQNEQAIIDAMAKVMAKRLARAGV